MRTRALAAVVAVFSLFGVLVVASPAGAQPSCAGAPAGFNIISSDASVIRGTSAADYICGGPSANTIYGLGGDDVIRGFGGADVIWGGAGSDDIDGGYGDDRLRGGYGNDTLSGGYGADFVWGGPGRDVLRGGQQHDVLIGGAGADVLFGGGGFDSVQGGDGPDLLHGGPAGDNLFGGKGKDHLWGDGGNDNLFGGTSHDVLFGGGGDDVIYGGDGHDMLNGDTGNDQIRGGRGDDFIRGGGGDDRLNGGAHFDIIDGGADEDRCLSAEQVRNCANVADMWPEISIDFGVDDETIRIGLSADLSGPLASATTASVMAQKAYFDRVNERGGIAGRQVELVMFDNAGDVSVHLDNYAQLSAAGAEGVVMLSHSTGLPHTSAIAEDLIEDDLVALSSSLYSGWATELGANVVEIHASYCIEAMNGVEFLVEQSGMANPKIAIISSAGEYGQDGAAGARIAADVLGLEIFDLEGAIVGDDPTSMIVQLIAQEPDIIWITSSPGEFAQIFGGAVAGGVDALWSGNSPSYVAALLDTPIAPALDAYYFRTSYAMLWDEGASSGVQDMKSELASRMPTLRYRTVDHATSGWAQAIATEAILRHAAANGDMTRAGVLTAANQVEVDFHGLTPSQSWGGSPDENIVRGSYFYDVVLADATLADEITRPGSSGLRLVADNFIGDVAANYHFENACFEDDA